MYQKILYVINHKNRTISTKFFYFHNDMGYGVEVGDTIIWIKKGDCTHTLIFDNEDEAKKYLGNLMNWHEKFDTIDEYYHKIKNYIHD